MSDYKTFELQTKIGLVYFIVNGSNQIRVSTSKRENFRDIVSTVIIRNKEYNYGSVSFSQLPSGEWDGLTYGSDGNSLVNVSTVAEWYKDRAALLADPQSFHDASSAAKNKFYDEIKKSLNQYYQSHKEEIDNEGKLRTQERETARIESLREKIKKLNEELESAQKELMSVLA